MSQYRIFTELADTWDVHAQDAEPGARRETLRECADALRMMVDYKSKPVRCPRAPEPFNYCPDCDGSFTCQIPGSHLMTISTDGVPTPGMTGLVERLRAQRDSGQRTLGGAMVASGGHYESWGGEPIMVLVNPDGPEAADTIEAREATITALLAALEEARKDLRIANDVIRLGRAEGGSGRVKVATSIHRSLATIDQALALLAQRKLSQ